MNALPKLLLVVACTALVPAAAHAAPQVLVLSESFDDLDNLNAWSRVNDSVLQGYSWFQGNPGIFAAQQGAPSSYAAASYLSADGGTGTVDNWLITPQVSLWGTTIVRFFSRSDALPGFADQLEVRFSDKGGSSVPLDFTVLLGTVGAPTPFPSDWQQITLAFDFHGSGRFGFRYLGDAAQLNYIGIDTVTITTVPEPAAWLMLAAGMCALALQRRFQEGTS